MYDERGRIDVLHEGGDLILITSVAGARRGNHWHATTGHWCVLLDGEMTYYSRIFGTEIVYRETIRPGQMLWTGQLIEHLFVFTKDSRMLCYRTGLSGSADYEADLTRLDYQLDECDKIEDK